MKVYYDDGKWHHCEKNQELILGREEVPLPFAEVSSPSAMPFKMSWKDGGYLGPLIGIVAQRKGHKLIIGNQSLVKSLQQEMFARGGITFLFAPEDVGEKEITGLIYLPEQKQWVQVKFPYPHIVYNRFPNRKEEQSEGFLSAKKRLMEKDCIFFNPGFIHKYELFSILKGDSWFHPLLPDTILITEARILEEFLRQHSHIYIKAAHSSKGKGIMKVAYTEDSLIHLEDFRRVVTFGSFEDFWKEFQPRLLKKEYIAQRAITPFLYDGKRFDFRVLVHFHEQGYEITGIGVRQAGEHSLTTHVPRGGAVLPLEKVVRREDQVFLEEAAKRSGALLSQQLGFFGEFSMDIGITSEEQYVIYEINSKPMSFDEKEIETNRIQNLADLFEHIFQKD